MTSTALLLLAAIAALCLGDDALREGRPNALTDDIDPELLKLIADGGDMGIDMADRDGRSLATASRLYRELKKKELLKTPTVQKPLTLEERRQKAKERFEAVRKMMKDNRERRLKGLPPVQIEIHGDPLSGKVGTGRSAAKEGEDVEDKSPKASDKEAKEQINPEASDKASQTGDNPNETSESAKKTKSAKSTENETLKANKDDVAVSGLEKGLPKGGILSEDSATSQPSILVTSQSTKVEASPPPTLHEETSSLSPQEDTTEEATSTTPSPVELSPVAPPPNPVSTASTIFPTSSDKGSHTKDQDQSSSTASSQDPLETSTAPAIAYVTVQPNTSPAPTEIHVPPQPIASPAPAVVPMHSLPSVSPAPVVIHLAAKPASPAPPFFQAPAPPIASPPPAVIQVPVRPASSPAPAVAQAPVQPETNPAVWPVVLTPAHHAVQPNPRANSWWPSEYGRGRAASPEQTEGDFQAWAAFEAAVAQERAAQEAVAAQRRAAELMAAQQRAAKQEEAAKQRVVQEAQETQRRAAALLAAQERAERQGAEFLAAQQRAIQEVMVAKQRAVELAAAQERAARQEAERMEAQQRAAQEVAVKEAAAALLAEQQRAEREEKAAQQRAAQRAALQDAIAQQQRAAQEAIVAQQIAQQLVTDQGPAERTLLTAPPIPDGPTVLGPPNPALTAPRIVDDLPNGDLENQREDDFQKWKSGLPRYRKPDSYLTPLPDGTLPPSPYTAPGTSGLPTLDEFERIMEEARRGHAVSKRDTTPTDTPSTTTPRHAEPQAAAPLWPRDPYMSSSTAAPDRHRDHHHHHVSVPGAAALEVPHTHNPYWPAGPKPEKPVEKKFRPTTAARPFQNGTNDGELQAPQGGAPSSNAIPGRLINQGPVITTLLTSTTARPEPLPTPEPLRVAIPKARPSGSRRKRHLWRGLQEPRDAQCALFGG